MTLAPLAFIQLSLAALAISALPDLPDNDPDPDSVDEAVARALVMMMH